MDRHIERLRQSARSLVLPEPDAAQVAEMVSAVIDRCRAAVPDAPGALYLRPLLFGTMPNIGAAATPTNEACLIVLASPVWDYFAGGAKPLRIYVEEQATRCASHLALRAEPVPPALEMPAPRSTRLWPHASRAWANWRSGFVRCYSAERIFSI